MGKRKKQNLEEQDNTPDNDDTLSLTDKRQKKRQKTSKEKDARKKKQRDARKKKTSEKDGSKKKKKKRRSKKKTSESKSSSKKKTSTEKESTKKKKKKDRSEKETKQVSPPPSTNFESTKTELDDDDVDEIRRLNEQKQAQMAGSSCDPAEPEMNRKYTPVGESLAQSTQPAEVTRVEEESDRVFCGNLPWTITEDELNHLFERCGVIANIHWVKDKQRDQFYGTTFLRFETPQGASKACQLDGKKVKGRPIRVHRAKSVNPKGKNRRDPSQFEQQERPPNCNTIFVGLLPYDITDDDIWSIFHECGQIHDVRWVNNKKTGEFAGCCFIEFLEPEATIAAGQKNGFPFRNRNIRVDFVQPKPPTQYSDW